MLKKKFAAASVAILAAFLILPAATAANAAIYVPAIDITVTNTSTEPGAPKVISISAGTFDAGTSVSFTAEGPGLATLSIVKAVTSAPVTKPVAANGSTSVTITPPLNGTGNYVVTGQGLKGGQPAFAIVTVPFAAADSGLASTGGDLASTGGDLASTGFNAPLLVVWGAVGVILLGVAMVAVLRLQRRSAASAVAAA